MKTKFFWLACLLLMQVAAKAQVKIGDNSTTVNSASLLELETTDKGFVLPRVSITNVNASTPLAAGLLTGTIVYNTNTGIAGGSGVGIYYWDGSKWNFIANTSTTANYWALNGNSGTTASSNFIGTADAIDLVTRTANTERMRILGAANGGSKAGWIGMGISVPRSSLDVTGNYTNKNVFTIQNTSNTGYSSVDMMDDAGVLKGTFGYANSGTSGNFAGRLYFNTYGDDFLLTSNSGTSHFFMKGGTGYIGLNTTTPSERLHLVGNFYLTGAFMPGGNAGTSGYVLTSAGAGASPAWTSASNLGWALTGNSGTNYATNFLGTTDNVSIRFRTNNVQRMIVDSIGRVGIGLNNPAYALSVLAASNPLYLSGVQATSTFNTDSILTINAGVVKKAPYSSINGSYWGLTGNSGTSTATNFIGTTDNQSLVFKTNNQLSGKIDLPLNSLSFGYQSANSITTGTNNVFLGYQSGFSTTTGSNNTGVGAQALKSNTGINNTGVGSSSLRLNTLGGNNTSTGSFSLQVNTTGSNNTATGYAALGANLQGIGNTANGSGVLQGNIQGNNNTAMGNGAMQLNDQGSANTAVGAFALQNSNLGASNTALGYAALGGNTSGINNTGTGNLAGNTNTTGTANTFIGNQADATISNLSNATAIGANAKVSASNSLVLGGAGVNVGIGTTNPSYKFQVLALSDPLYLGGVQATAAFTTDSLLTIYNGVVKKAPYSSLSTSWSLTGNSGTNYATNFLGTTDNTSMRFRTNNTERMIIDSLGNVGIGSSTPFDLANPPRLFIDNSGTTSDAIMELFGNRDGFIQVNMQNKSNGANASSDYVATADDGTDSTYYIDMGINSSTYAPGVENFGGPHDGYLYTYARNLLIGAAASNTDIIFLLNGGRTRYNTALRMEGSTGNIIIGTGNNQPNATGNIIRGPNGSSGINIPGGSLTLQGGASNGNTAGGNLNLYGGGTVSGSYGSININTGINGATNINTGTSTGTVTIGNSLNNINLPKLSASSVLLTDAGKNLTSTIPSSNTYLYYNGTNFTWATAATLGSFSATTPLTYNNATGVFAINKATTSADGYLSFTDWNTFNNKVGSITLNTPSSVFTTPINFSVASGAATGTLSLGTQAAGTVFAGPANVVSGTLPAVPTFRALIAGDIPSLGASYIQNQTTQQALSNFNISGNGIIGTNLAVTGTSTLTGLLTSNGGYKNTGAFTTSGGIANINANSNFATNINTGTSTSNITMGNSANNILFPKFNTTGGIFFTSASTGQIANTATDMQWDEVNDRLGIGLSNPGYKLSVLSSSDPLYLSGVQTTVDFTTDSVLTIYNGIVKKASYSSLTGNFWNLTGNSTTYANNFLGTKDNVSLRFRTNNIERMLIDSVGGVGIGSSAFNTINREKLLVDYGTTTSHTLATLSGSIDDYFQINLQNKSSGTSASTDYVATADDGTETSFYVDLGINSSNYAPGVENWGGPHDAYLYSSSRNLLIGTQSANSDVIFMLGGGKIKTNAALRLNAADGNIVVGKGESSTTPVGNVIRGPNGSGTNIAGGSLTLQGGSATGTATGGDININGGTGITGGALILNTSALERMRINASGNIGIGITNPSYKLSVLSLSNPLYLSGVQATTTFTTDSILTINAGIVKKTPYSSLPAGSSSGWALTGNSGTSAGTNFLGTTDAQPLVIKSLNRQLGYFDGNLYSIALGFGAVNNISDHNVAIGYNATTNNQYTLALGYSATATGVRSIAIGNGASATTASGAEAIAVGYNATASGVQSTAFGYTASATGSYAIAMGYNAQATINADVIAIGRSSVANAQYATAIGYTASATGLQSTAIGYRAQTAQSNTILLGDVATPNLYVGIGTATPTAKLHIVGGTTTNYPLQMTGLPTGTIGTDNILTINSSGVVGYATPAAFGNGYWSTSGNAALSGNFLGTTNTIPLQFKFNSIVAGYLDANNTSFGTSALSTSGLSNTAIGYSSTASNSATAIGANAVASQLNNTAVGNSAITNTGSQATAIGASSQSLFQNNVAIGYSAQATVSSQETVVGALAQAQGQNNISIGYSARANGSDKITVVGSNAQASFQNNTAVGSGALATVNSQATAIGALSSAGAQNAIALGYNASASGTNSTAIGVSAITSQNNAMVLGTSTTNVGIGTSTPNTSTKLDVAGSFKLGTSGTVLSNIIKTTVAINPGSMSAGSTVVSTVTLTGAATGNSVIVNPRSVLPAGVVIAYYFISAANTLTVVFTSAVVADPPTTTFDVSVIQ